MKKAGFFSIFQCLSFNQVRNVSNKGIKQRRACLYPVLETCYDAAEHEKALRAFRNLIFTGQTRTNKRLHAAYTRAAIINSL